MQKDIYNEVAPEGMVLCPNRNHSGSYGQTHCELCGEQYDFDELDAHNRVHVSHPHAGFVPKPEEK